jgi:hypothetical protein
LVNEVLRLSVGSLGKTVRSTPSQKNPGPWGAAGLGVLHDGSHPRPNPAEGNGQASSFHSERKRAAPEDGPEVWQESQRKDSVALLPLDEGGLGSKG